MIPKPLALRKDDYKDAPEWATRMFQQLNEWFSTGTQALTRGLVRAENMRSTTKTVTFRGSSDALTVKHDLGQRPATVWVGSLRTVDGSVISAAWSFTWLLNSDDQLSVRFQGLTAGLSYEAQIIIE